MTSSYFDWIYDLVCRGRYDRGVTYRKLLRYLYDTEFTYIIPRDDNRAEDGICLRDRFNGRVPYGPSSVLETMVMLAIRCEELMDDTSIGDRTSEWFWNMIVSLGLGSMYDSRFDEEEVARKVDTFLNREYEPNGRGGLFTIPRCDEDLRNVEIWFQLLWYLDYRNYGG